MRTQFFLYFFISFLFMSNLDAQNNKIEGPLQNFVNTSFMLKFKDVKIEAEAAVRRFKAQSQNLNAEDVQAVQTGYEQSAYRFNQLLSNIKSDFLNAKKVKYISQFPDDYMRSLELELGQLTEFYSMHFLQPLADANAEQVDGSAAVLLIVELVGLTKSLVSYFSQVRQHSRRFSENYLQQNLILPFRFRSWDEISAEGSMMPSPAADIYSPDLMEAPSLDPLLQETTNLLAPNPTYQEDGFQQGTYQSADTYDEWLEESGEEIDWDVDSNTDTVEPLDSIQQSALPKTPSKAKSVNAIKKKY